MLLSFQMWAERWFCRSAAEISGGRPAATATYVNARASRYVASDLCVLVPTMNRPEKLTRLFESLAEQTQQVGRIIVVDGAENAEGVADKFRDRIPVEYYRCQPPGQIRQRNYGLSLLAERDKLVALLDDDIVLEAKSVERMVKFWNETEPETGGVCFNIINGPAPHYSQFAGLLGLGHRQPGRVLRSGLTTANTHVKKSMRVSWVPGGATVWRREVLLGRSHREIAARWAIGEDLLFSYPTGKKWPLYICADARVRHEHVSDYGAPRQDRYHGRTQTLWMYHFVASNNDLSRPLFLWTLSVRMAGKTIQGLVKRDRTRLEFVRGQASALVTIAGNALRRRDTDEMLHENGDLASVGQSASAGRE
jgi:glycosyltransferase involved in cell wall biosynthesis